MISCHRRRDAAAVTAVSRYANCRFDTKVLVYADLFFGN